MFYQAAYTNLY